MIVVSNTSPIVNLAAVGQLDLLLQLYGKVLIPSAVFHEIAVVGAGQPGATEVQTSSWIETRPVANQSLVAALRIDLDEGEAEAIALAVEVRADLLLLDERRGRAVAARLGIKFIGLLGVLMEAKHQGLIRAVKPVLDDLIARAGFWVSGPLYAQVLQTAGE
jgi:predicted nucleic acid-binding protein